MKWLVLTSALTWILVRPVAAQTTCLESCLAECEDEEHPVMVRLRPNIRVAEIAIDDERVGDLADFARGIPLSPGLHSVRFSHPTIQTATYELRVPAGVEEYDAPPMLLSWRDATLIVQAESAGAVFVDYELVGQVGEAILLPFQSANPERRAVVSVVPNDGSSPWSESMVFHPGQQYQLTARLGQSGSQP